MLQNRGEQSRFRMEKKVVNMKKTLVKMEKVEKVEKIIVILEKILVTIRAHGPRCQQVRARLRCWAVFLRAAPSVPCGRGLCCLACPQADATRTVWNLLRLDSGSFPRNVGSRQAVTVAVTLPVLLQV
jgi:hypothetical protein